MKQANLSMSFKILLFLFVMSAIGVYAQNPIVKIDFDMAGRSPSEVNDPDYTSWVVSSSPANTTVNGVTFTVTKVGPYGDILGTNWYKAGVQNPNYAKLVCDGVTVKNGTANQGGQIELRISGLPAGDHTLLAFLNAVDSDTYTFSPIDVSVDDNLVLDNVVPTVRALTPATARSVYLEFTAAADTDVVILFAAETSGSEDFKNVMLNGFELNTPNIFYQATNPIPAHNDEHVELNSGNVLLQWSPAVNAVSHNIYFGMDEAAVTSANTSSSEFMGNQTKVDSTFQVTGLYTGDTYFWRIDEVLDNSDVVQGNIWRFRPAQLAFPGAEGYGRFARGGRGGKVVVVTNLNDNGPGSLREAVTNDIGPRTIVFNVSGLIQLYSPIVSTTPYVTIAGQTAPGKGITIKGSSLGLGSSDNILQHIRVRLGYYWNGDAGGMGLKGNYNIMDHCSISWTVDEALSSRDANNITFQHSMISEALNDADHPNYPAGTRHGYAASIGGGIGSFHHNLLAHNYGRNWSLAGGLDGSGYFKGQLDITNNVVYNWGSRTTDGGAKEVNFVGNYYKPGPGMELQQYALTINHEDNFSGMQRCYFDGNTMPGFFDETNQEQGRRSIVDAGITVNYETFVSAPFFPSYVTTQTADEAYKMVLSDVGCTQPVLDDHDQRIIAETLNGTYTYSGSKTGLPGFPDNELDVEGYEEYPFITRPANWDSDNDGLPNWWETYVSGTPINSGAGDFSDTNADSNMDGYTNMDYYLQWMSLPHYSTPTGETLYINIQQLSRGFENNPTYQISNIVNGNFNLNGDVVEFTPLAAGLGSFEFTVNDNDGDSMTREVNILNGYDLSLSVDKKNISEFKIWPIPNKGSFYIKANSNAAKSEFKIFDILGKEVLNGSVETGNIKEVTLNTSGFFILKIFDSGTKQVLHTQKIIIQ